MHEGGWLRGQLTQLNADGRRSPAGKAAHDESIQEVIAKAKSQPDTSVRDIVVTALFFACV